MPLYEFICPENHEIEIQTTCYDAEINDCPVCHKPMSRLMGRQTTFLMDEKDRGGHV